jgi:hypothetical protein
MDTLSNLTQWLAGVCSPLWESGVRRTIWTWVRILWLCAYQTVAAVGIALLFVVNDQGQDLLRISVERGLSLWNLLFFVGTAALGLGLWYTARLLLGRDFPTYPIDPDATRLGRKWLPRIFGAAVPLAAAVGFLRLESDDRTPALILAALYFLLAIALVWLFILRRQRWMANPQAMVEIRVRALEGWDRVLIRLAVGLSFALFAAFMVWPVWLPQHMGAPAIVVLGFAGIVLFGSMVLTYAFLAAEQPAGTSLFLALAVLFAFLNDDHWVRLADGATPTARPAPGDQYTAWRRAQGKDPAAAQPLVLVAASGGGIRAAYWTASTLALLEQVPGFTHALFAISGVSGGSLGAAVYVALKREQLETGEPKEILGQARQVLAQDFLCPVLAGLLFSDLVQRFLPFPIPGADRQRFLERSWEAAIGPAPNPFSRAFTALYADGYGVHLPGLLLNATVVDSGRRAIVSNMAVGGLTDVVDLLADGYSTQRVKLSAAAGMSARFTYVSPAGSLTRPDGGKMRVVDGGYFENSGAATAMDLLAALRRDHPGLIPILVLIRNDPEAAAVCHRSGAQEPVMPAGDAEGPPAGNFLSELSAPVRALLNARTARGRLAEVEAAKIVEDQGGAVVEIPLAAVLEARLNAASSAAQRARMKAQAIEPPLGWSLSDDVRRAMDQTLDGRRGGLRREIDVLREVLVGRLPAEDRCNPR